MPTIELPPWLIMWTLAAAIFAVCKWLTWWRSPVAGATVKRQLAYLFLWPGLDARAFLAPQPLPREQRPTVWEFIFAITKLALGVIFLWLIVPMIPSDWSILSGWIGMTGIIFLLHFGSFHLISCYWRAVGVKANPLMNWPILATSVSDFWARRWNTAFRDFTHRFLFFPLANAIGPKAGIAAGFLFSGIVHDLVISIPAQGGYGWPTFYFAIQGLGLLLERSRWGKRLGLNRGPTGRLFTVAVIIGPAYGLFHPPFVLNVINPFLVAIGAR